MEKCEQKRKAQDMEREIAQEYDRCVLLEDYYEFRRKYPNSKLDEDACRAINKLEKDKDDVEWAKAVQGNSIESYKLYIKNQKRYSSYVDLAKTRLRHCLLNAANDEYRNYQYTQAKKHFEEAHNISPLDKSSLDNYIRCCEEVDFLWVKESNKPGERRSRADKFIYCYPRSRHLTEIKGIKIDCLIEMGLFGAARKEARREFGKSRYWVRRINIMEKEYKRKYKRK